MKLRLLLLCKMTFLALLTINSQALTELDLDFNYKKNIFGLDRESYETTRMYAGSVTFYFLSKTGIELNISQSENEIIGKYDNSGLSTGLVIENEYTNIKTQSFGIGIRQALSSRKSFLQPLISLGWSRQQYTLYSTTLVKDLDTSTEYLIKSGKEKSSYDAMFGAFALKVMLTRTFSIKGSVRTVFRAFEFEQARDQLSYNAGISWLF
ncbi:hypothetical protein ABMA70_05835 [Halobacteriovorax sp. XZX-3]|uniref:hypothetical protein n=1 Tax=unclassified Halobacteriovorax TaxID=2639665 RepID=UPI000CD30F36|nr:hypothetical protein [Halobacteriovorax sp. DA5]POB14986.1 hypothetical protein C0Z22_01010 [Halobacteriovorax sp. DA5]